MVDSIPNNSNKDLAHALINYDDKGDHANDRHYATEIISLLKQGDIQVDGCLTFLGREVGVSDFLYIMGFEM